VPDRFQPLDVAVVGGGISGLACAFWLKRHGLSTLLLEATGQVGGCVQSLRTGPYVADGGPQSFLLSADFLELIHAAQLDALVEHADPQASRPYLYHHGALVTVPQGPRDVFKTPLLSLGGKLCVLNEAFVAKRSAQSDESIASFVRRRAGAQVLDSFVEPFVSGIFAGDVTKLSMQSVFPAAVQLERTHGSVLRGALAQMRAARRTAAQSGAAARSQSGAQSRKRATIGFRGGNDALPKVLAHQLGNDVRTNTRVTAMWQRGEWLEILLNDDADNRIVTRAVVLATPASVAGGLVTGFNPQLAAQLNAIGSPPVVQIALAYPREAIGVALDGFGFLASRKAGLRILGCVFNSVMFPERCPKEQALFTVFLGGATDPQVFEKNDAELTRLAHADLQRVLKISNAVPTVVAGFRWPQAIPQYNLGHAERIQAIENAVADIPHLHLCGNYLRGPSVPDCAKRAKTIADAVSVELRSSAAPAAVSTSP